MVNGEQFYNHRLIRLPFTVYCLPIAVRFADIAAILAEELRIV